MFRLALIAFLLFSGCSSLNRGAQNVDIATLETETTMLSNFIHGAPFDLQGHRGARGLAPENTIPAFIKALEIGVTTLEMDAVISKDQVVFVSHEPWMNSAICSHPDGSPVSKEEEKGLRLYEMTAPEIALFDCGSRGNPTFPQQIPTAVSKPTLQSVLEAVSSWSAAHEGAKPRFNIEIKSSPDGDGILHPSVSTYAELLHKVLKGNDVLDRTSVQSFDERALVATHQIDPTVSLVWLISNDEGFEANMAKLPFIPSIYSPNHNLVDAALVQKVHEKGMQIIPWTINETDRMRFLMGLGIDGLITDYPDRAKDVLSQMN